MTPASFASPQEAQAIAREAIVFAYPMLFNYKTLWEQTQDQLFSGYTGGLNRHALLHGGGHRHRDRCRPPVAPGTGAARGVGRDRRRRQGRTRRDRRQGRATRPPRSASSDRASNSARTTSPARSRPRWASTGRSPRKRSTAAAASTPTATNSSAAATTRCTSTSPLPETRFFWSITLYT